MRVSAIRSARSECPFSVRESSSAHWHLPELQLVLRPLDANEEEHRPCKTPQTEKETLLENCCLDLTSPFENVAKND